MRAEDPEGYARTRRFCLPHDYLNLWLTGEYATEPGDASGTAYFDARSRSYSAPVLAAIDPERDWQHVLPPVRESLAVHGTLRADVAGRVGLAAGVPVSGGGGDNMCTALGEGAISEGRVLVSLGTSGTVFARRAEPSVDPLGEAAAFCSSDGGWLPLACTLNATAATSWVEDLLQIGHADVDAALRQSQPGAGGVSFLPYLGGERTPELPDATATLTGLRTQHGRDELIRAVAEGVTFGLAYGLAAVARAGVAADRIALAGGGSASDEWAQLCADIFGLVVERRPVSEAAALGAALQARWVVDGETPPDRAPEKSWEPRIHSELEAARERHAALRELAKGGYL